VAEVTERRFRIRALTASLLVHLQAILLTWDLSVMGNPSAGAVRAGEDVLEVTLIPDPAAAGTDLPDQYTAIPERLAAAEPPEKPEYLALHHSLAADLADGGEQTGFPGAEIESELTKVAVRREELEGAEGVVLAQEPRPQERDPAAARLTGESEETGRPGESVSASGDLPVEGGRLGEQDADTEGGGPPGPTEPPQPDWVSGSAPSILKAGKDGASGDRGFDFDQFALGRVEGNVEVTGAFTLNTTAWDWAPWMHRFEQDLYRNWIAPYAYLLGVISGVTRVRLVVELDGRAGSLEVLESEGHESLHQASVAALKAFAPYPPLPPGFPEENLVITISLHYPPPMWKRERFPRQEPPEQTRRRR